MRHQLVLHYLDKVARVGSIRAAAEELSITPSALNRRILTIEEELGVEIFERHAAGVRLNLAGEIFLQHVRTQLADMERVRSRIADLTGLRRGHINIACTREVVRYFLPSKIRTYRDQFPGVTFSIQLYERGEAEAALIDNSADIALVFEPIKLTEFQTVMSARQPIYTICSVNHPLAARNSVRLYEVLDYPCLLPSRPEGIRQVLDNAAAKAGLNLLPVVESNSLDLLQSLIRESDNLSFTIGVNLRPFLATQGLTAIKLDSRDVQGGFLFAGHLRGRTLPVAAARFLEDLIKDMATKS
ncbi:MAG: LysR family transcriptional regulator [Cohaesibacter sp.]|jgi:DNA-binding transcriptional LysR family regulator|nr:LysR family transcriptional regulator [Cohaesibacter sp.]